MRQRRFPVVVLLAGLVVSIGAGVMALRGRPALEPDMVLPARFGNVVWNHEMHARMKDIANCQVCHHQERAGVSEPRPCRECHLPQTNQEAVQLASLHGLEAQPVEYGKDHGPPPMTAFHGRCVGCHTAMQAGPVGCRDCHAQEFSGAHGLVRWDHHAHARRYEMDGVLAEASAAAGSDAVTADIPAERSAAAQALHARCVYCHHQDEEALTEADYRACSECHEPAATKGLALATGQKAHEDVKHGECARCHVVANPEEDRRSCQDCHGGWVVDPEVERPALEQAVHRKCADCHHEGFDHSAADLPVACNECHEPDPSLLADLDVGLVLWDHDRHANYGEGMECTKCHHADASIEQPHMSCNRCHGSGLYDNPPVATALRQRCLGCHQEKENGLLSWDAITTQRENVNVYVYEGPDGRFDWNHRDHAVAWSFSCRNCHHGTLRKDGVAVTAAKAQAAWTGEGERIQACSKCHGETGPVDGSPAAGSQAPSYDDAYRKICLECHVQLQAGPQTWDDYFRVEPLKRNEEL